MPAPYLHPVPTAILAACSIWGHPADKQLARQAKGPIECFVGDWEVEFHFPNTRTALEFPRPGRGDEVTHAGTTVIGFQVHPEMMRHVPEWPHKTDEEKVQAAAIAILGIQPYPGVSYEFIPSVEIKRQLQWPYTPEEVAFQTAALKHAD